MLEIDEQGHEPDLESVWSMSMKRAHTVVHPLFPVPLPSQTRKHPPYILMPIKRLASSEFVARRSPRFINAAVQLPVPPAAALPVAAPVAPTAAIPPVAVGPVAAVAAVGPAAAVGPNAAAAPTIVESPHVVARLAPLPLVIITIANPLAPRVLPPVSGPGPVPALPTVADPVAALPLPLEPRPAPPIVPAVPVAAPIRLEWTPEATLAIKDTRNLLRKDGDSFTLADRVVVIISVCRGKASFDTIYQFCNKWGGASTVKQLSTFLDGNPKFLQRTVVSANSVLNVASLTFYTA